jgi:uncharacterized membrane protein YjgN (DUF898 family)
MEKIYLSFHLEPKKLIKVWFLFVGLILAPYILQYVAFTSGDAEDYPVQREFYLISYLYAILVALGYALFYFKFATILINSIAYKETNLEFTENFFSYFVLMISGILLCIITLGFYVPWFIASINRFFTDYTRYKDDYFEFNGKGASLFKIFLLWIVIPIILIITFFSVIFATSGIMGGPAKPEMIGQYGFVFQVVFQIAFYFITIPFFFLSFKWRVNTKFKDFQFEMDAPFFRTIGFIALQLFFSVITLGIFLPLAFVNSYHFVLNQIKGVGEERTLHLEYDLNTKRDFFFIWGQFFLVILSIGFYYPWAFKKMGSYILSKTSLQFQRNTSQNNSFGELPNVNFYIQVFSNSTTQVLA